MTLYLKTRPQTIDELDLTEVRESLKKIVSSGKIPHALLFAGPKGTGKTSAARILAKVVNCERPKKDKQPCNRCSQCLSITKGQNIDVIELDAASNRGIDDIRTLRESILLAPAAAKKKIYIIDEAHMLTTEAANAFLKTLEEPPSHVMFILATTDPQKLPATIRSRLMTIIFHQAQPEEIKRQLNRVIKTEKIKIDSEATKLIANSADGSFRDAVKILDALSLQHKKITQKEVLNFLSQSQSSEINAFLGYLSQRSPQKSLAIIQKLIRQGSSIKQFTDDLIASLRAALLATQGLDQQSLPNFTPQEIIKLLELLINSRSQISHSPVSELPLEIVTIKWCSQPSKKNSPPVSPTPPAPKLTPTSKKVSRCFDDQCWTKILSEIRSKNTSIEALLRAAEPLNYDGKCLSVGVYYRFHKERLESNPNRLALEEVAEHILGSPVRVSYELTERKKPLPQKDPAPGKAGLSDVEDNDIIQAAKEIFGN